MKRIMIVALSVAMVACGGTKKGDDKKGDEQQRASSVSVESSKQCDEASTEGVCQMAVNYKEMAMSALENGDAQNFMAVMERRETWYNSLSDDDKAKVDASDKEWVEANAERMEKTYDKALTLSPHAVPTKQASERK